MEASLTTNYVLNINYSNRRFYRHHMLEPYIYTETAASHKAPAQPQSGKNISVST